MQQRNTLTSLHKGKWFEIISKIFKEEIYFTYHYASSVFYKMVSIDKL